jgi:hypothetical protein
MLVCGGGGCRRFLYERAGGMTVRKRLDVRLRKVISARKGVCVQRCLFWVASTLDGLAHTSTSTHRAVGFVWMRV